jgi:hypothetical protein
MPMQRHCVNVVLFFVFLEVVSAAKLNARMVMFADRPWPMRMPAIQKHRDLVRQMHASTDSRTSSPG